MPEAQRTEGLRELAELAELAENLQAALQEERSLADALAAVLEDLQDSGDVRLHSDDLAPLERWRRARGKG